MNREFFVRGLAIRELDKNILRQHITWREPCTDSEKWLSYSNSLISMNILSILLAHHSNYTDTIK